MTSDELVYALGRLRDYGNSLSQAERKTLQNAIDAIHTPDKALDASLPTLATLDSLLTVLADVPRYKKMLADLTGMVRQAKEDREAAAKAAADLEHKQATIGPSLASAAAAHARELADKTADFDKRVSQYQKSLSDRQALLDSREQLLAANEAKVEKLRIEFQDKLDRIRTMAA